MELICQPLDIVIVNCCALCNLNRNQMGFLKQMKCDSIQGYYYSRPLPKEEFEKLLLTA